MYQDVLLRSNNTQMKNTTLPLSSEQKFHNFLCDKKVKIINIWFKIHMWISIPNLCVYEISILFFHVRESLEINLKIYHQHEIYSFITFLISCGAFCVSLYKNVSILYYNIEIHKNSLILSLVILITTLPKRQWWNKNRIYYFPNITSHTSNDDIYFYTS